MKQQTERVDDCLVPKCKQMVDRVSFTSLNQNGHEAPISAVTGSATFSFFLH